MKTCKKMTALLLALLMLTLCLAGCNKSGEQPGNDNPGTNQPGETNTDDPAQNNSEDPEAEKYGGTLVVNLAGDPRTFNPDCAPDNYINGIVQNLYSRLVQMNIDEEIFPDLATDWEYSEDGKTVTFHLQEKAIWHDGEPLTSEDVKFTFETVITEKGYLSNLLTDVVAIECPDEHTVQFTLAEPNAAFLSTLSTYGSYILPKHLYEGTDWLENPVNLQPVGSGPFKFVSQTPGSAVTLEAFDGYFRGRPYLDKIIYSIIPDKNTAYQAFLKGELDILGGGFPPGTIDKVRDDPNYKMLSNTSAGYDLVVFNFNDENFQHQKVREAVALSISNQQIVDVALKGEGIPAEYYFPVKYAKYLNDDVKLRTKDIEAARKCLEEAGYTADADGFYFDCTLDIMNDDWYTNIAPIIVENLKEAGIRVSINSTEFGAWADKVRVNHNFEFTLLGGEMSPDISMVSRLLLSDGMSNYSSYSNPKVDELFNQGIREVDLEKRYELYKEVQVYLAEDLPILPMYNFKTEYAIPAYVMGHPWTEPSKIYYSPMCWAGTWFDESLRP